MNAAKVQLSAPEMSLVSDANWILTKNAIMEKVAGMLVALGEQWQKEAVSALSEWDWDLTPSPKISKGEHYQGLPWIVLDYPRIFGKEDIFAIRTLFWWGNYFSVTLHLKGRYKHLFLTVIQERAALLAEQDFHIGISSDEWRHEVTRENYAPLRGLDQAAREKLFMNRPFLKISAVCGFEKWHEAPEVLLGMYQTLLKVLQ